MYFHVVVYMYINQHIYTVQKFVKRSHSFSIFFFSVITCTDPPQLTNGRFVDQLDDGPYVLGAIVEYKCNTGYQLSTTDFTRTCQRNSTWTMENIACVVGKVNHLTCIYLHVQRYICL